MGVLEAAIARQGGRLILLNVLLQQLGVPVPAEPTLLVAGSLVARGRLSISGIAIAVLVATLVADMTWFIVGRRYGARALQVVFRVSSSPEKRRGQVERLFARWGSAAFAVAKFIPGLPMASPALAGALGISIRVFLLYDLIAMTLWGSTFTSRGIVFHADIDKLMGALDRMGGWALLIAGAVVLALAASQLRRRVQRRRDAARVRPLDANSSVLEPAPLAQSPTGA
jgi:membrane protein DedA with SNARE-associated domain